MRGTATFVITCVLTFTLSLTVQTTDGEQIDYYWRDYTGVVPKDAVPGGIDQKTRTIYIGQVYVRQPDRTSGLLPVAIYNGSASVTVEFFGVQRKNEFVKILCSSNPDSLKWLNVDKDFREVTYGQHLVPGGSHVGKGQAYILHIGRTKCSDSLEIGRILQWRELDFAVVMYGVCNGVGKKFRSDFEVLTYRPTPKAEKN